MLSYFVIQYERFRKVMQRTEKVALTLSLSFNQLTAVASLSNEMNFKSVYTSHYVQVGMVASGINESWPHHRHSIHNLCLGGLLANKSILKCVSALQLMKISLGVKIVDVN